MERKKEVKESCCACKANFEKAVDKLVDEVEDYSKADHEKKERELDKAFGKSDKK